MKTNQTSSKERMFRGFFPVNASPGVLGLSVLLVVVQLSSAAEQVYISALPHLAESNRINLGTIAVISPRAPAEFSFESGSRKAGSAVDGAEAGASTMVSAGMSSGDPFGRTLGFALAPVGALVGSIREGTKKMPAEGLTESAADLAKAMAGIAVQNRLRDAVLKVTREKTRLRFVVPSDSDNEVDDRLSARDGIDTVLELGLESLRLQRTSSKETSYALFMNVRARLVRAADGTVLYDSPLQYRSGTALFIDWTLNHSEPLGNVAATGYSKLAEKIVDQLFVQPAVELRPSALANNKKSGGQTRITPVSSASQSAKKSAGLSPVASVTLPPEVLLHLGRVGIVSTSTVPKLALQRPLVKEQATRLGRETAARMWADDDRRLEQLQRTPGIDALLMATVTPVSLVRQTVGQVKGVPVAKYKAADDALSKLATEVNIQEALRGEVLRQAQEMTTHPIVLVKKPFPPGAEHEFSRMSGVMSGTLAWLPEGQAPGYYLRSQGIDTVLEIRLLHPALTGDGEINPPMAFNLEAQASLLEAQDGRELYLFSMKYESPKRKFTDWAANDAQPLREELQRCYRSVAARIIDELSVRAWPPESPKELAAAPTSQSGAK
jgi:hypothetical protein